MDSERLQFLAGFESYSLAGRDADFLAGARISADAGLAGTHIKNAEPPQFNALALRQRSLHALKDCFHSHFSFCLGNSRAIDYFVDDVEFNQSKPLGAADDPARQT